MVSAYTKGVRAAFLPAVGMSVVFVPIMFTYFLLTSAGFMEALTYSFFVISPLLLLILVVAICAIFAYLVPACLAIQRISALGLLSSTVVGALGGIVIAMAVVQSMAEALSVVLVTYGTLFGGVLGWVVGKSLLEGGSKACIEQGNSNAV